MVKLINENVSEYVILNKETNAKFRFEKSNKSKNYFIRYYSSKYEGYKSLGTITKEQFKNDEYRNQIQKTIEMLFETSGGERDFIIRCKSIYGKRLRTETCDIKLTLWELEQVENYINSILRAKEDD